MTKKTFSRGKKVLSQSYSTLLVRKVSYSDDGISMQLLVEKRKGNKCLRHLMQKTMKKELSSVKIVVFLTIVQYWQLQDISPSDISSSDLFPTKWRNHQTSILIIAQCAILTLVVVALWILQKCITKMLKGESSLGLTALAKVFFRI